MNARKQEKTNFEKTSTFEFQNEKYMTLTLFEIQYEFILDTFSAKIN